MSFFFKQDAFIVWQATDETQVSIHQEKNLIRFEDFRIWTSLVPSTREEFTAAAMQAIEKLKAQGIDIGTDWLPKWEPKVGEVVWCWDESYERPVLGRYKGRKGCNRYPHTANGVNYQHVAPFTGEIPEPFKSRWAAEAEKGGDQ